MDEEYDIIAGSIFPSSWVVSGNSPRAYATDEEDLVSQACLGVGTRERSMRGLGVWVLRHAEI